MLLFAAFNGNECETSLGLVWVGKLYFPIIHAHSTCGARFDCIREPTFLTLIMLNEITRLSCALTAKCDGATFLLNHLSAMYNMTQDWTLEFKVFSSILFSKISFVCSLQGDESFSYQKLLKDSFRDIKDV